MPTGFGVNQNGGIGYFPQMLYTKPQSASLTAPFPKEPWMRGAVFSPLWERGLKTLTIKNQQKNFSLSTIEYEIFPLLRLPISDKLLIGNF